MTPVRLNIGGELRVGDFIGIAYSNWISFGWYKGPGRGTIQYIGLSTPVYAKQRHDNYVKRVNDGEHVSSGVRKLVEQGFSFKNLTTDYALKYNPNRVFKISNPEEFFNGSTYEQEYLVSKQLLCDLNFLKP
jgi:hypothetical protein